MKKLMTARIGWFETPTDEKLGGTLQYLIEHGGVGGERFNFEPHRRDGRFYGYIKGKQGKKRDDGSLLDQPPYPGATCDSGWTIAFMSTDPVNGGQRLIGWYENATFAHDMQSGHRMSKNHPNGGDATYCVETKQAFFVPPAERTKNITKGTPLLNNTSYSWLGSLDGSTKFDVIRNRLKSEIARLSGIIQPLDRSGRSNLPRTELSTRGAKEPITYSGRKGGEGKEHKALREYVCLNPEQVIPDCMKVIWKETEFELPSADIVDVAVETKSFEYVIEVKSRISNTKDFERGVYQCVKYRAVYDALYGAKSIAILVTETALPDHLKTVCQMLDIKHVQVPLNRS